MTLTEFDMERLAKLIEEDIVADGNPLQGTAKGMKCFLGSTRKELKRILPCLNKLLEEKERFAQEIRGTQL